MVTCEGLSEAVAPHPASCFLPSMVRLRFPQPGVFRTSSLLSCGARAVTVQAKLSRAEARLGEASHPSAEGSQVQGCPSTWQKVLELFVVRAQGGGKKKTKKPVGRDAPLARFTECLHGIFSCRNQAFFIFFGFFLFLLRYFPELIQQHKAE